ncbi:hypothetical protein JNUCC42_07370 [Brevibacterium sp. JNUCC-42]|nr:hypothetical protein JNUCC42_07370 [Brevibacterium sp. JNUCC-42]
MENGKRVELITEEVPVVFSAMFDLQTSGGQSDYRVIPDTVLLEGLYQPELSKEKEELLKQWTEMQNRLKRWEMERTMWQEQIKECRHMVTMMESQIGEIKKQWEMVQLHSEKWRQKVEEVVLQWYKEREQIYQIVLAIKKEWEASRE